MAHMLLDRITLESHAIGKVASMFWCIQQAESAPRVGCFVAKILSVGFELVARIVKCIDRDAKTVVFLADVCGYVDKAVFYPTLHIPALVFVDTSLYPRSHLFAHDGDIQAQLCALAQALHASDVSIITSHFQPHQCALRVLLDMYTHHSVLRGLSAELDCMPCYVRD
ncbi:hypothetical protein PENSPDRAFT_694168 [Peniophora sp. CONT]|nr:hypothetical protein PENSPDRAFT_694168 [Peniophora sp. CONT]